MRPPERSLIGPSRLVILLRALLVSQALRRRRGTEVGAAIPASGSWPGCRAARSEAAAAGPGARRIRRHRRSRHHRQTAATGSRTTKAPARSRREASPSLAAEVDDPRARALR